MHLFFINSEIDMTTDTLVNYGRKYIWCTVHTEYTDAEFLDEIGTKVLRVFRLAIHSHL
jgi:hypothetical protein